MDLTDRQRAMQLHFNELLLEFTRTRDFQLVGAFLKEAHSFERREVMRFLFWRTLESRDWDLAQSCISNGYPVCPAEFSDGGPIHECISTLGDRADIVGWLLDHGAEIERRWMSNVTPLMASVASGCHDTAELLLDRGADVNASTVIDDHDTALSIAARTGNEAIVKMLLGRGADPRRFYAGADAAEIAAMAGHDAVSDLIRKASQNLLK